MHGGNSHLNTTVLYNSQVYQHTRIRHRAHTTSSTRTRALKKAALNRWATNYYESLAELSSRVVAYVFFRIWSGPPQGTDTNRTVRTCTLLCVCGLRSCSLSLALPLALASSVVDVISAFLLAFSRRLAPCLPILLGSWWCIPRQAPCTQHRMLVRQSFYLQHDSGNSMFVIRNAWFRGGGI